MLAAGCVELPKKLSGACFIIFTQEYAGVIFGSQDGHPLLPPCNTNSEILPGLVIDI